MTGSRRYAQVAVGVASLTLASRIVGFGRWLVFSKTVGDTCLGDAYNSANQLPNVLFEIVAGGILASVVVPVISRQVAERNAPDTGTDGRIGPIGPAAARTASAMICWTLLVLSPVALAAILGARLYAATFVQPGCSGAIDVAAALLVIFAPQIWLYGLAVVSAGILQALGRFTAAAAAPLASSAVVIATYLIFAAVADPAGRADPAALQSGALAVLGWGTTGGVLVLSLTTLIPLLRSRIGLFPTLRFPAGVPRVIIAIAGASLAGLVMQQLSVLAGMLAARDSGVPGAWTRAVWASAVYLLPYAVLIYPLHHLIFPRLGAAAHHGQAEIGRVLARVAPVLITLAGLGCGLLIGVGVPVARLLVLGPGSGDTWALAWPIIGYGPAVIGFALMGLATRTLYAEHRARPAGITTVVAWGTVIIAIFVVRAVLPGAWVVTGIAVANSVGMIVGAILGWTMIKVSREQPAPFGMLRPAVRDLPIGVAVGIVVGFVGSGLAEVGFVAALAGAVATAAGCLLIFTGLIWLLDRRSVTDLLELWRSRGAVQR